MTKAKECGDGCPGCPKCTGKPDGPSETVQPKTSQTRSMPEVLKAIDGIITALEKFPKTKLNKLPDPIILGIGKLNGAISKLTTYVEEK